MNTTLAPDIITFGCRLNSYESEVMRVQAEKAGLRDAVIFNGCAVTGEAERQLRQAIRKARRERPEALIVVTGCAAQIAPEKYAQMPEVNAVLDNADKLKAEAYRALARGAEPDILAEEEIPVIDGFVGGLTRGFVPIQYGCDHACTYCIVPFSRGRARSLPLADVVRQIRVLLDKGYPEITLTGVDIASYETADDPTLGQFVRALLEALPDLNRLRLSSLDPARVDDGLWELIATEPRLMPSLHLSLQAGDDLTLKRMKRRHTRNDVMALCRRARSLRPDMTFGADIIAGFPTETEAMFAKTLDLVDEAGLTWLHVFPYSARAGTPAAKMPQIPMPVRKERAQRLREKGALRAQSHIDGLIGKRLELHVEQPALGRTPCFAEVVLDAPQKVGSVVLAEIMGRDDLRATAQVIEDRKE